MKLSQLFCVYLLVCSSLSRAMDVVPTNPPLNVMTLQTEHPEQLLNVPNFNEKSPDIVCIQHTAEAENEDPNVLDQIEESLRKNYLISRYKTVSNLVEPKKYLGATTNIIAYKKDSLALPKEGIVSSTRNGLSNWINIPLIQLSNGNEVHIVTAMPQKDPFFGREFINQTICHEINKFAATAESTVVAFAQFAVTEKTKLDLTILSKSVAYKLSSQKK